jgi:hypothetical protein
MDLTSLPPTCPFMAELTKTNKVEKAAALHKKLQAHDDVYQFNVKDMRKVPPNIATQSSMCVFIVTSPLC